MLVCVVVVVVKMFILLVQFLTFAGNSVKINFSHLFEQPAVVMNL